MPMEGSTKTHFILSTITLCCAAGLLISGIVASSWTVPIAQGASAADEESAKSLVSTVSLGGTIPGVFSLLFSGLGMLGAMKGIGGLITTQLVFNIILIIAHLIASLIPLLGAAIVQTICDAWDAACNNCATQEETQGFCGSFKSSLWAVVVFSVFCIIMNFACSITGCQQSCCNKGNKDAAPAAGVPVAQPVN